MTKKKKDLCFKYPLLYGSICKGYMTLENNPLSWGLIFSLLCSLTGIVAVYFITKGDQIVWSSIAGLIGITIPFIVLKPLLNYLITLFNCSGINGGCIFSGKYFDVSKNGEPCKMLIADTNDNRFEFATEDTLYTVSRLNALAYRGSNWQGSIDNKLKRNSEHFRKNDKCLMLLKTHGGIHCGFTHILPVPKNVWDRYTSGKIGDNDFSATNICSSDMPEDMTDTDEVPYGLIIFSVASVGTHRDFVGAKDYKEALGDFLEKAIVHHMKTLCDKYFTGSRGKRIPVLLQNMDKCYYDFFKPCATSLSKLSKDKVRIIEFEVSNYDGKIKPLVQLLRNSA